MQKKYLIIGTSAAGVACANTLRRLDPDGEITCLTVEVETPYNKCFLADYAGGAKRADQIGILPAARAAQQKIAVHHGVWVSRIDRGCKEVVCDEGQTYAYDQLLIATGSSPVVPSIEGLVGTQGCFSFHTLHDVNTILSWVATQKVRKAIVIGAGLSGLECADALHAQGVQVTVIEWEQRLLTRHVDARGAAMIADRIREGGVQFLPGTTVTRIISQQNNPPSLSLHSSYGVIYDADMVVYATGVDPNSQLARDAGLTLQGRNVAVDDRMRTSDPHICAAGDVVAVRDTVSGEMVPSCAWPDAMQQGMVAAHAMVGVERTYTGAAIILSASFFGIKFVTAGPVADPPSRGTRYGVMSRDSFQRSRVTSRHCYRSVLMDGDRVRGFVLVGDDASGFATLRRALLTGEQLQTG